MASRIYRRQRILESILMDMASLERQNSELDLTDPSRIKTPLQQKSF